jgi:hypothetical protein
MVLLDFHCRLPPLGYFTAIVAAAEVDNSS